MMSYNRNIKNYNRKFSVKNGKVNTTKPQLDSDPTRKVNYTGETDSDFKFD